MCLKNDLKVNNVDTQPKKLFKKEKIELKKVNEIMKT